MRSAGRAGTLTRLKVTNSLGQTGVYLRAPLHPTLWFEYISEPISTRLAKVLVLGTGLVEHSEGHRPSRGHHHSYKPGPWEAVSLKGC